MRINITDELNYVSLDTVIARLEKLRDEHGGDVLVDVGLETVPYTGEQEPRVELYINNESG